jgi:hypothetical protein
MRTSAGSRDKLERDAVDGSLPATNAVRGSGAARALKRGRDEHRFDVSHAPAARWPIDHDRPSATNSRGIRAMRKTPTWR